MPLPKPPKHIRLAQERERALAEEQKQVRVLAQAPQTLAQVQASLTQGLAQIKKLMQAQKLVLAHALVPASHTTAAANPSTQVSMLATATPHVSAQVSALPLASSYREAPQQAQVQTYDQTPALARAQASAQTSTSISQSTTTTKHRQPEDEHPEQRPAKAARTKYSDVATSAASMKSQLDSTSVSAASRSLPVTMPLRLSALTQRQSATAERVSLPQLYRPPVPLVPISRTARSSPAATNTPRPILLASSSRSAAATPLRGAGTFPATPTQNARVATVTASSPAPMEFESPTTRRSTAMIESMAPLLAATLADRVSPSRVNRSPGPSSSASGVIGPGAGNNTAAAQSSTVVITRSRPSP